LRAEVILLGTRSLLVREDSTMNTEEHSAT